MNYENYQKSIVLKYKVKLNGWPNMIKFANPSHISTVDGIRSLRHALQSDTCQWVRLSDTEYAEYTDNIMQQEQSGQPVGRKRKERSDKGKRHSIQAGGEDAEEDAEGTSTKRRRMTTRRHSSNMKAHGRITRKSKRRAVVLSEEEDEEEDEDEEDEEEDEDEDEDDRDFIDDTAV